MKLSQREIENQEMRLRKMAYMNSPERLATLQNPFMPEPKPAVAPKPKQGGARKKVAKKGKISRKRGSANRS